jgi:hypothetical protein
LHREIPQNCIALVWYFSKVTMTCEFREISNTIAGIQNLMYP